MSPEALLHNMDILFNEISLELNTKNHWLTFKCWVIWQGLRPLSLLQALGNCLRLLKWGGDESGGCKCYAIDCSLPRHCHCWHTNMRCVCVLTRPPGEKRHWPLPPIKAGLVLVSLPLGADVNKIKSATLTLPGAQGRPFARLHPTFLRKSWSTNN